MVLIRSGSGAILCSSALNVMTYIINIYKYNNGILFTSPVSNTKFSTAIKYHIGYRTVAQYTIGKTPVNAYASNANPTSSWHHVWNLDTNAWVKVSHPYQGVLLAHTRYSSHSIPVTAVIVIGVRQGVQNIWTAKFISIRLITWCMILCFRFRSNICWTDLWPAGS